MTDDLRADRSAPSPEAFLLMASLLDAPPEALLSPEQAGAYLGVRPATLAIWRSTDRYGLPYLKIGRLVRYKLGDLRHWLESRSRLHTGQPNGGDRG